MQDALGDPGDFLPDELAGILVESDEPGHELARNVGVRPVHAVGGGGVEDVAHHERRAARDVVREDAHAGVGIPHVEDPEDVGVLAGELGRHRGLARAHVRVGHEGDLVLERAVVAVGQPVDVEADHFAPVGDEPEAVFLDGGPRNRSRRIPSRSPCGRPSLGTMSCQRKLAGLLVEAQEVAAVAGDLCCRGETRCWFPRRPCRRRPRGFRRPASRAWRPTSCSWPCSGRCPRSRRSSRRD